MLTTIAAADQQLARAMDAISVSSSPVSLSTVVTLERLLLVLRPAAAERLRLSQVDPAVLRAGLRTVGHPRSLGPGSRSPPTGPGKHHESQTPAPPAREPRQSPSCKPPCKQPGGATSPRRDPPKPSLPQLFVPLRLVPPRLSCASRTRSRPGCTGSGRTAREACSRPTRQLRPRAARGDPARQPRRVGGDLPFGGAAPGWSWLTRHGRVPASDRWCWSAASNHRGTDQRPGPCPGARRR